MSSEGASSTTTTTTKQVLQKKAAARQGNRACLRAAAQTLLVYGANLEVFNLTDVEALGYTETTARRAIGALLDWGAVRRAAPHAYVIGPEIKARFLKEVAVSQARARVVLLEAFGMERWDEKRIDSFLSDFKELWRRRSSETALDRAAGTAGGSSPPPPTVGCQISAANC